MDVGMNEGSSIFLTSDRCEQVRPDRGVSGSRFEQVTIVKAANGFIVHVGCQTFVATTWDYACEGLREYWCDPVAARRKYCKEE